MISCYRGCLPTEHICTLSGGVDIPSYGGYPHTHTTHHLYGSGPCTYPLKERIVRDGVQTLCGVISLSGGRTAESHFQEDPVSGDHPLEGSVQRWPLNTQWLTEGV